MAQNVSDGITNPVRLVNGCKNAQKRLVLRKFEQTTRLGWADASREIAALGEDALAWPDFANEGDEEWEW